MTTAKDTSNPKKPGFFARLKQRLNIGGGLGLGSLNWLSGRKLDAELEDEIEERLLLADVGVETTQHIIAGLRKRLKHAPASDSDRNTLTDCLAG